MSGTKTPFPLKSLIVAAALLGVAAVGAALWLSRTGPAAQAEAVPVLKIGNQKGTTKALMEAAGVLDNVPYRIEWAEFPAAQHLLEGLSANAVDVGLVGDAPFLIAYAGGSELKIVAATAQQSKGSTALIVRPDSPFKSVKELKGKRIATGKISIGYYILLRALERDGLTAKDVDIVFLPPADAKAAFLSGRIDGWVTWGPFLSTAIIHDKARVLVDSRDLRADGHGYHVATPLAIKTKTVQLRDFRERLARAYVWSQTHEAEYGAALAKETGLPLDVALETVSKNKPLIAKIDKALIADAADILKHLSAASGEPPITRPVEDAFASEFIE